MAADEANTRRLYPSSDVMVPRLVFRIGQSRSPRDKTESEQCPALPRADSGETCRKEVTRLRYGSAPALARPSATQSCRRADELGEG